MKVKAPQPEAVDKCELFGGRLTLAQPREGYRFSLDSILLAWWVDFEGDDRIINGVVDMEGGAVTILRVDHADTEIGVI